MKQLPAPSTDLRDYLPAIEPERQVSDWGRSERVEGLLDKTIYEFLYHYWFRCEVEGIENVPADGGALLVSNHSGALPPDATMIPKAVKEEHPRPRPVHLTVEHFFKGNPLFSMLVPKIGGVPAHPANVHRLLYDEGQLVLVFPEGRKGTEKLYKDRYQLRRFGRGGFVEAAMRAQVPIVPIAVVGAEESMPIFAQHQRAAAADRAPVLPDHADLPALRAARLPRLPAGQVPDPLPRADPDRPVGRRSPSNDRGLVQTVADEIRARIQEELHDMLAKRTLGLVRMRVLVTGLSTFWGGRLAQALERDPDVETIIGVSPDDPTLRARAHRVRPRRHPARAAAPDRAGGRDRHGGRLAADRRLDHRQPARRARDQRDRDDEHPRRLLGPGLAGAQVRLQVVRALLRLRAGRPGVLHRARCSARTRRARGWSATSSRPRTPSRTFAERNPDVTVTTLRFVNGLGPDLGPSHSRAALAARWCRRSSASTRATSSSTRTTSSACSSTPSRRPAGRLQRRRRRGARALGGREPARQAAGADPAAVGDRAWRSRALQPLGLRSRPRCSTSCASAAGSTTASSRPRECRCATPRARPCRRSPSTCGWRRSSATRRGAVPLRARGRGVPALQPERRVGSS